MDLQAVSQMLDTLLRYREYPDFIVNLLQTCDPAASQRYEPAYLQKTTGLLLRAGTRVDHIYTAAFPSDDLIAQLVRHDASNALLIVKHPMDWEELGRGFVPMSTQLEAELQRRSISVYCAHAAHDNFEACSPSRMLVTALGLVPGQALRDDQERMFGYLAELEQPESYAAFRARLTTAFGIATMQERHAHEYVQRLAIIAGGGDQPAWLRMAEQLECDTYLTGILYFQGSAYARQHNPTFIAALRSSSLNAFGISHYLSELQGSIALASLVGRESGLPAEFLAEESKAAEIRTHWGYPL